MQLLLSEVTWCLAPAPCSECGMQFLHQHVLDNHMKSVHNLGVQCPICEKRVSGRSSLGTHMARMHKHKVNGILHPCPHCGNLYGPIYLKEHIALCHPEFVDGKGTHECPHCQGRFHRKPVFLKHLRSCSKNPERSRQRRRRRLINPERDESGRFICEICGKSCATKLTLTNHIDGVHKKEEMKWRRNHICHVCGKVLSNKGNFNIHQEIHKGKKRRLFPCHLCSVTYTQKSHVLSHLINVHGKKKGEELTPGEGTPPKRHRCLYPACELKFAEEQQLQNHVEQSHTVSENEEKFMCNACGRVFQNNGALARHSFSHSGEKPHKCEHCTSSGHPGFTRKSSLMEHLMAVHGEGKEQQYFPCKHPGCEAKFTCPPYLQAHMRSVHKMKKK
ncbi:unnamed protein product [Orchesella dallaii]|uniref:C2H2-type domain-containing protein n=1 Tax=Orchesella dallaii TaxID=48710 RepID=A0ABP1RTV3_9HEXA